MAHEHKIRSVEEGGIAWEMGIEPGDKLLTVNGQEIEDIFDYRYYIEEEEVLFSGDTLFAGSVGRTDFPTGSMSTLVRSVKERLLSLPEDTQVYPGHMEATTIGFEKENNPFL